ncbi:MAG: XkdF-like putative serine protease domain-containing protein [Acidobacteriota bacterium]
MQRGELGKGAAVEKRAIRFAFAKVDEARRLVTAKASVVTYADGRPVVDHEGDVIPIGDLEDAFIEAFADGGLGKGGENHTKLDVADIVQHFTLSRDERVALGFGPGEELGIVKFRVTDDATWKDVLSGKLAEVSIAGNGERVEIDEKLFDQAAAQGDQSRG